MAGTQSIRTLSAHDGVSRKFVYQQMHRASGALERVFDPQVSEDPVLLYLPVTKAWLRQAVVALVLLCHSSYRGVVEFLRDLLDTPISLGTVHNIVQAAVTQALQTNATQGVSRARASTLDEQFQLQQPVLTGLDLDSLYCELLAVERHRDANTWAIQSAGLKKAQGLHSDYTLADGAWGKRVASC